MNEIQLLIDELFHWKSAEDSELVGIGKLKDELGDILVFNLLLAGNHGLDVLMSFDMKFC